MAVTSGLTSLEDFEAPGATFVSINTGGGASDNTDVFIEGSQSGGRRIDNATDKGFMATISSTDLSGAGEHVKQWVFCFHWPSVTGLTVRIWSGTTAFDNHEFPVADIPVTGGFIPLWVDVSRTPDSTSTSGANEAAILNIGSYIDIGNVGGAGDNYIIDEIHHGTDGLTWSGASGTMADFRTYEDTNSEGNLVSRDGVDFLYSRLTIGDSVATGFVDSGFTIVCPNQVLVSSTFMGLTVDLQNASTAVTLSNFTYQSGNPSGATNRPDLLVTSTSGSLDMNTATLNGLRTIELNSACTLTNSTILNTGVVDTTVAGTIGADMSGTKVLDSTVAANASALVWDVNSDPDGELDNMSFSQGAAAHHAIEFGVNVPASITLRGIDFTGFSASDDNDGSVFKFLDTTGNITLNLVGCTNDGSGFTVDDRAGVTVTVVIDPVTALVNVKDDEGANVENARVIMQAADATGPLPFEESVTITRSGTVATVSHTAHGLVTNDRVVIKGITDKTEDNNGTHLITVTGVNSYTYVTTNSGSTNYTGTIISTGVVLEGLTDVNGDISRSRTYSGDQPIKGFIRKSSASPRFKTFSLAGNTIDSTDGLTINASLILDE